VVGCLHQLPAACCLLLLYLAASVIGVAARGNWIIRSRQKAKAQAAAEVSRSWSKAALREIAGSPFDLIGSIKYLLILRDFAN